MIGTLRTSCCITLHYKQALSQVWGGSGSIRFNIVQLCATMIVEAVFGFRAVFNLSSIFAYACITYIGVQMCMCNHCLSKNNIFKHEY